MSLTVRYPNGTAVTYNGANHLFYDQGVWKLYDGPNREQWIASIQPSAGAIVEAFSPCSVQTQLDVSLEPLTKAVRRIDRTIRKQREGK